MSEFEDSLLLAYRTRTTEAEPPVELTERLLYIRELLTAHPPPETVGAYLLVVGLRDAPFWFPLRPRTVIGRGNDADLAMRRSWISRAHCAIEQRDNQWRLVDLQSQNGVQVNETTTTDHILRQGDVIHLGKIALIFVIVDAGP